MSGIRPGMLVVRLDTSGRRVYRVLSVYETEHDGFAALIRARGDNRYGLSHTVLLASSLRKVELAKGRAMNREHPATRGRHNAEAICENEGADAARAWLDKRRNDTDRAPLDPLYIRAFLRVCDEQGVKR